VLLHERARPHFWPWSQVGADLTMGSLIKSPGGTIVTGGGYIAGRADLVAAAGARLTAPGVGLDAGAVPGDTLRLMFQGAGARCASRIVLQQGAGLVSAQRIRCRDRLCMHAGLRHDHGVSCSVGEPRSLPATCSSPHQHPTPWQCQTVMGSHRSPVIPD